MSILKYIKGRYLVIKGCRGSGRSRAEALRAAAELMSKPQAEVVLQAKPQPRDYIERVEVHLGPLTTVIRYKWINTVGEVVGWYTEEGLRALRADYGKILELPLAPGVPDEFRRAIAVIDEALGDNKKKGGARA